jgi:hypothetical protein
MSFEIQDTLDESQQALENYHEYKFARHVLIFRIIESCMQRLTVSAQDIPLVKKLRKLLSRAEWFYRRVIHDSYALGEERNFYYFIMKDLEEILSRRNSEDNLKMED